MASSPLLQQLFARGLLSGDDETSDDSCRSFIEDTAAVPITGTLTFHHLITYISLLAAILCLLTISFITIGHLLVYRQPRVQKQLVRIVITAPAFAVCCAIGVVYYQSTAYVTPWAELYEAFALIAVMRLMIVLLLPAARSPAEEFAFFAEPVNGGAAMFTKQQFMVYQLLPVKLVLTIAAIIVSAVFCVGSEGNHRGHLVISIISGISTVMALMSLFRFLMRHIKALKQRDSKIVGRLLCFKLIVFVQMLQRVVLSILSSANVLNPTATLSYDDLNVGLNPFLTTVEVMLISLIMVWYYFPGEFRSRAQNVEAGKDNFEQTKMSFFAALWDVINLSDVIKGIIRAVKSRKTTPSQRSRRGRVAGPAMPQYLQQPQQTYQAPPAYGSVQQSDWYRT